MQVTERIVNAIGALIEYNTMSVTTYNTSFAPAKLKHAIGPYPKDTTFERVTVVACDDSSIMVIGHGRPQLNGVLLYPDNTMTLYYLHNYLDVYIDVHPKLSKDKL